MFVNCVKLKSLLKVLNFVEFYKKLELKAASVPTKREFNQKKEWLDAYMAQHEGESLETEKNQTDNQHSRATVFYSILYTKKLD